MYSGTQGADLGGSEGGGGLTILACIHYNMQFDFILYTYARRRAKLQLYKQETERMGISVKK